MDFSDFGCLLDIANRRGVRDGRAAVGRDALERLITKGLVQRHGPLLSLTRRGEIALDKLG